MIQLTLDIARAGADDTSLIVTEANRAAVELLNSWPEWLSHCAILVGPEGSGKTLLAQHWATRANAQFLDMYPMIDITNVQCSVVIDPAYLTSAQANIQLFHLYNHLKSIDKYMLMTLDRPLVAYKNILPDIYSRLQAAMQATIEAPDDEMIKQLLHKSFSQRQLMVSNDVLDFLVVRIERSYAAIHAFVAAIDALSLEQKRNITIPLVKKLLH